MSKQHVVKFLFVLIATIPGVQAQTITTTTEIIREETTIVTVTQSGSTTTTVQSSVPIVYKCNGRTCVKP